MQKQHRQCIMNRTMYLQKLDASKEHLLHIKDDVKLYQRLRRHVAYILQDPFRKELVSLQDQDVSPTRGR